MVKRTPDHIDDDPFRDALLDGDDGTGRRLNGGGNDVAPQFSDEALALRFAGRYANDLRYVAAWSRWLSWDGTRWCFDATLYAFDRARSLCREAANEANKSSIARVLASGKTIAAVERLAKADRRIAATIDQWDADPWLLNTPDGIIDLRTGEMRPARIDDYCTKVTAVAPGGACPTWVAFLRRVAGRDDELIAFLQRMCGYALTGVTREHALFFLYGTGANGKSVFVNTVSGLLGDYHTTAPIETFTASYSDHHPTDLAGLRGARLVTATETEEGRRWAKSKIKSLTGGDKISARFMRQDFFEFVPAFKLMIAGNHKPGLLLGGRGDPAAAALDPVRGHHPAGRARQEPRREPQDRVAGHPRVDDRRMHGLAGDGTAAAGIGHGSDRAIPRSRRRHRRLDRRMLPARPASVGVEGSAVLELDGMGDESR